MSSTVWCICIASTKKTKQLESKKTQPYLRKKEAPVDVGSTVYNHSIVQFDPFKIRSSLFSWMKELKSDAKKERKNRVCLQMKRRQTELCDICDKHSRTHSSQSVFVDRFPFHLSEDNSSDRSRDCCLPDCHHFHSVQRFCHENSLRHGGRPTISKPFLL